MAVALPPMTFSKDPAQEQFLPVGFFLLLLCGLDQAFERAARHPKLPPGQNHQEMCNLNYSQTHQTELLCHCLRCPAQAH